MIVQSGRAKFVGKNQHVASTESKKAKSSSKSKPKRKRASRRDTGTTSKVRAAKKRGGKRGSRMSRQSVVLGAAPGLETEIRSPCPRCKSVGAPRDRRDCA